MIAAQVFDRNAEKIGEALKVGFMGRSLAALPGRPLLGRDAEVCGALFAAAATGIFFHALRADVGRDDAAEIVRDRAHWLPLCPLGRQFKGS